MNPLIKAFWETIAPVRSMPIRYDEGTAYIFFLEKEMTSKKVRERVCVARQFLNGQIKYSTGNFDTVYTESQMLRIIKLKAFL